MADETIRIELDCSAESFHMHYELEILYVLSGRTAVMLRDSNVVLESDQFIVFNV